MYFVYFYPTLPIYGLDKTCCLPLTWPNEISLLFIHVVNTRFGFTVRKRNRVIEIAYKMIFYEIES